MSGKYRRETVRHVILLLSALVIALILSFYFSEKVFAAETLPAASAENEAEEEEMQRTEAAPESGTAEQAEEPEETESGTAVRTEEPEKTESGTAEQMEEPEKTEIGTDTQAEEPEETEAGVNDAAEADAASVNTEGLEMFDIAAQETATGANNDEDADGGGEAENAGLPAGAAADPLTYLRECLQYHGDEENPSAFSLRVYTKDGQSVVTPVKSQSPWNTCWGFAAIAASESSILSECYAKWDQLAPGFLEKYGIKSFQELCEWLDLSERQIAWFSHTPEPEDGNYPSQAGEGLYANQYGMSGVFNALGNMHYATSVFARGTGPLEESRVPYQNNAGALNEGVTVTANDGTKYLNQKYLSVMSVTGTVEYECLIPLGMTKEDVLARFGFDPALQERLRQRLEQGVLSQVETNNRYVDDSGKYYRIARRNQLNVGAGYPKILIYEDEDGKRYSFDPVTMSYPGLPDLHVAYYDWSVDDSLHYASIIGLENTAILPNYYGDYTDRNEAAIKAIKDELLAGRGVSVSFCADSAREGSANRPKYINTANNIWAHYTDSISADANHMVTIVGYNDRFPRTLFLEGHEPPKDGAWLVKNSWGGGLSTGTNFGTWGIDENGDGIGDGYFWLSYCDFSIKQAESFDYRVEDLITDRMEYDIRQYDLITVTSSPLSITAGKEANVFTAELATNVREIGVQHSRNDTTISYEIYLLKEDAADPTDGILLASGSEHFKYAGFHRMKTDKVCIIPAGRMYSVVVTKKSADNAYASVLFSLNAQYVKDREDDGVTGIKRYTKAVVNRGESYLFDEGKWTDWVDSIPEIRRLYAKSHPSIKENWLDFDNFSIKAYADYIIQELCAEATEIGSGDAAAAVGAADAESAKKDALVPLAAVHNEISNNLAAENAPSVKDGYISADDYSYIAQTLIDPDRATGLKVVVSTVEIAASELTEKELAKLLAAAEDRIARYADISLLVLATDSGEYLGSLHKTDAPIDLAMAIPSELLAAGNPVYVLRLHDGVVERLATMVKDGIATFASDLFSKFALAYDIAAEPAPVPGGETAIVPGNPAAAPAGVQVRAGEANVTSPATGDSVDLQLWLALLAMAAGAALTAAVAKKAGRM